jgi:isoquinoline 1-oxidoreductase beta subunit
MTHIAALDRRSLLKGAAGTLVVGFVLTPAGRSEAAAEGASFAPNAFVRITPDSVVTVLSKHLEMGQGTYSGLARIVAEELDADWAQMRVEGAPANAALYANTMLGVQATGGSSSIANSYDQLRKAGATARALLVQAAAKAWNVPAAEITVSKGVVRHVASKREARFGALAGAASRLPVPETVALKDPKDFVLIGKPDNRLDTAAKSDGSAVFGIDVKLPGLLTAVVAHAPRFGATVKSFDGAAALAVPGVRAVFAIPTGVAVVADGAWPAMRGRDSLHVEWDDSKAEMRGTPELLKEYRALADQAGKPAKTAGDVAAALKAAARVVRADYEVPYLAHAAMEPMDCVVRRAEDGCELWYGCQFQTVDQGNVAKALGLKPEQVKINTLFSGGSFGRRANFFSDYVMETVAIAKQLPAGTPVRLMWTREDDMRAGRYRPMYYHRLEAGLDPQGKVVAWRHRIVGQSIMAGTPFEAMMKDGIDGSSVEGAINIPYAVSALAVELHTTKVGVPVLWWRSVGSSHNAFVTEAFLDRLAREAGQDPVAFRRSMMAEGSHHRKALDLVAEKAGWGSPLPAGRARGVAVAESFATTVAQVVEVSREANGRIRVHRVVCAVHCGVAVNPRSVAAQMEGGIAFGLSAALKGAITLKDGKVEQGNFDTYDVLRMDEMPEIEVHIVPSDEKPTGTGEPGVPPIAPALANAIYALTGKPVTALPLNRPLAS